MGNATNAEEKPSEEIEEELASKEHMTEDGVLKASMEVSSIALSVSAGVTYQLLEMCNPPPSHISVWPNWTVHPFCLLPGAVFVDRQRLRRDKLLALASAPSVGPPAQELTTELDKAAVAKYNRGGSFERRARGDQDMLPDDLVYDVWLRLPDKDGRLAVSGPYTLKCKDGKQTVQLAKPLRVPGGVVPVLFAAGRYTTSPMQRDPSPTEHFFLRIRVDFEHETVVGVDAAKGSVAIDKVKDWRPCLKLVGSRCDRGFSLEFCLPDNSKEKLAGTWSNNALHMSSTADELDLADYSYRSTTYLTAQVISSASQIWSSLV